MRPVPPSGRIRQQGVCILVDAYQHSRPMDWIFPRGYRRLRLATWGWYASGIAAEPFVVSAVATYVPLLLEQLARENAVWVGDHRTPCIRAPSDSPGLVPIPIVPPQCVVRLGWMWIDTSSLPLYTFSVSVVAQTLLVISVSGCADRTHHRTAYLVGFSTLGSASTILLAAVSRSRYYVAAILSIIAIACFGAVSVVMNAYLPLLVSAETQRITRRRQTAYDWFYGACGIEPAEGDVPLVAARVSGRGVALGYAAAFGVQIATMLWLSFSGEDALQWVIGSVACWWLVGQLPVALWLRDPRPRDEWGEGGGWTDGWRSLGRALTHIRELKDASTFLLGWFLLSDAVTTINSTAVLFARANLQMATPALALIGLVTVVFAIVGSLLSGHLLHRLAQPLVVIALLGAIIPLYGVVGFFSPWFGLRRAGEMYALAAWYGLVLGAINATCRSMFSLLIPPGREAMFFALYAVTDKGSSVVGPLVTGMITDRTHNIRYSFYFLLVMMIAAAIIFSYVDFVRGVAESKMYALVDAEEEEEDEYEGFNEDTFGAGRVSPSSGTR